MYTHFNAFFFFFCWKISTVIYFHSTICRRQRLSRMFPRKILSSTALACVVFVTPTFCSNALVNWWVTLVLLLLPSRHGFSIGIQLILNNNNALPITNFLGFTSPTVTTALRIYKQRVSCSIFHSRLFLALIENSYTYLFWIKLWGKLVKF